MSTGLATQAHPPRLAVPKSKNDVRQRCVSFPPVADVFSVSLIRPGCEGDAGQTIVCMRWLGWGFGSNIIVFATKLLDFFSFPSRFSLLMLPPCVRVFFSDASPVGNFRPRRCCRHVDPAASKFFFLPCACYGGCGR